MAPEATPPAASAVVALETMVAHVLGLAKEAHSLLERAGRPELARRVSAEADRYRNDASVVVVAGPAGSGKSSLVNALVGRPRLLPVAVHDAPVAPIWITWGEVAGASVERFDPHFGLPETVTIELDELARNATAAGVRRLEVRIPSPLLAGGLVLVDTPGSGSLRAGYDDLTLGLLHHAHAVVFVTSAEAPLLRSEAEFLAQAALRVSEVLLVATKGDLVEDPDAFGTRLRRRVEQLSTVLDGDAAAGAARLREIAARPPVLTSARLAERAGAATGEQAARLRALAGIGALDEALRRRLTDVKGVRLTNTALTTSVAATLALTGEAVAGQTRMRRDQAWVSTTLARAGDDAQRALASALNDLERRYRDRVRAEKELPSLLRELPVELEASLLGAWLEILAGLDAALAEAAADVSGISAPVSLPERLQQATSGRELARRRPRVDPIDHALPGLSIGAIVGQLSVTLIGGPAGWVLGAATGAGAIAARSLRNANAQTRQQATTAVGDAIREARTELSGELRAALAERRALLLATLDAPPPAAGGLTGDLAARLRRVASEAETFRAMLLRRQ